MLRICLERKVPVTPRGAGSGMCGGALPIAGGVVLSTERMTRIKEIDAGDLVAVVEPGVVTGRLQEAVEAQRLFYPPDPASLEFCSIGGNASTNAGGPRAFKYGVTREYVLGLEVALMGGEVLRCGRRTAKGVTGYDLVAGFVGTEGTFGVITELTRQAAAAAAGRGDRARRVRRRRRPPARRSRRCCATACARACSSSPTRASIDVIRAKSRYRFPDERRRDRADRGRRRSRVDGDEMEKIGLRCDELGALDVLAATEPAERRAVWEARRLISPSLKEAYRIKVNEDVCVPRGRIVEMLARVDRVAAETGIAMRRVRPRRRRQPPREPAVATTIPHDPAVRKQMWAAAKQVFAHTIELGGTLSGEHGIGLTKRDYMLDGAERAAARVAAQVEVDVGSVGLLNPGKKIPARRTACSE